VPIVLLGNSAYDDSSLDAIGAATTRFFLIIVMVILVVFFGTRSMTAGSEHNEI
jgi:hypothetical protein